MAKTSHAQFTNELKLQDNTVKLALLLQHILSRFLPARLFVCFESFKSACVALLLLQLTQIKPKKLPQQEL